MKRRAIKLLQFLLAGAIINLAISVALISIVSRVPTDDGSVLPSRIADELWRTNAPRSSKPRDGDFGWRNRIFLGGEQFWIGSGFQFMVDPHSRSTFDSYRYVRGSRVGLPTHCIERVDWFEYPQPMTPVKARFRPLWFAMFANSAVFATVCWLAISTPLFIRRLARRRRGQCASCGYSLRECTSDKCPECGVKVMSFFAPRRIFRRVICSLVIMAIWLYAIYLIWFIPSPWHIAPRANLIPRGFFHPIVANMRMGTIHRINPPNAALAFVLTGLITWGLLKAYQVILVNDGRRRNRDCCDNCGYPIGTSPVCTECGHAVIQNSADQEVA